MFERHLSLSVIIIMATLSCTCNASMSNSQPQFTIKAVKNKEFDEFCLIGTFNISSGNIADCLEHCLQNCRCQSFQICQNTKCQLCSSHKEENSSLLRDKDGCVYATYEMRHLTGHLQPLEEQCSGMSCLMKYNCCQQSGLCLMNATCKPINSQDQPWKRFTCECPKGYDGVNCDPPMTSCQGYANGSRKSGMYKVVDSDGSLYEVYCHFDSDGAWTLVQSYSFANGSATTGFNEFHQALSFDNPVGEYKLVWSGYRLRKARMKFIEENSLLLRFTCNHQEKIHNVEEESDYLQLRLKDLDKTVFELSGSSASIPIQRGKIGGKKLQDGCSNSCYLYQYLYINLYAGCYLSTCGITPSSAASHCNAQSYYSNFGNYKTHDACFEQNHGCSISSESTTQIWFGN